MQPSIYLNFDKVLLGMDTGYTTDFLKQQQVGLNGQVYQNATLGKGHIFREL